MKYLLSFLLTFALAPMLMAQTSASAGLANMQHEEAEADSCGLHLAQGKLTAAKAREIQICLKQKGYLTVPISDELTQDARKALLQYQIDNNLPQGNLNLMSLRMLGRSCKCGQ